MPFLFVWTAMFTIPLMMATGVIGLVQYLGYLLPGMSWVEIHGISLAVVVIVTFALYRRVAAAGVPPGPSPIRRTLSRPMVRSGPARGRPADRHLRLSGLRHHRLHGSGTQVSGRVLSALDHLFHPRDFFRPFGRLQPRHHFPPVALLMMSVITAIGSFFTLTTVISVLLAVFVIVQALAQVAALTVLRRRQPGLPRPYRQWLYPLPSLVAFGGWGHVYVSSGHTAIIFSLVVVAAGALAFLLWAKAERQWPLGPST
jgi:hypothetical protein